MKRKFSAPPLLSAIVLLTLTSCEYYLGINQQPEFQDRTIEEGMNIFGILRPDNRENFNKSFVFVQQIWPALEMDSFAIIKNVTVHVEQLINDTVQAVIDFPLMPSDSLFSDTLYRPAARFTPQPRERYRLVCRFDGLPDAIGETICPPPPEITENSLLISGRVVSFSLQSDTLIRMLDIYQVTSTGSYLLARIVSSDEPVRQIVVTLPTDPENTELKIYGYDTHLAAYYANSNTSLNFNKYRTTVTTLESGFGVFGSLNFISIEL